MSVCYFFRVSKRLAQLALQRVYTYTWTVSEAICATMHSHSSYMNILCETVVRVEGTCIYRKRLIHDSCMLQRSS